MYIQNLQKMMLAHSPEEVPMEMMDDLKNQVWAQIRVRQGETFYTSKEVPFTYRVDGYDIYVSEKEKPLTRANVNSALVRLMNRLRDGEKVSGSRQIGGTGSCYLYPMFVKMKVYMGD